MAGKSPLTATDEQRAALATLAGSRDRGEADRARAVLLTLTGWTSPRIAEAFGVREDTVRLWRSDFAGGGIEALKANVAPGPAPVKSETALRVVTPLLEQPVADRRKGPSPACASRSKRGRVFASAVRSCPRRCEKKVPLAATVLENLQHRLLNQSVDDARHAELTRAPDRSDRRSEGFARSALALADVYTHALFPTEGQCFLGGASAWVNAKVADANKVFHSFKHTFKRDAGTREELHDAPTGHSRGVGGGFGKRCWRTPRHRSLQMLVRTGSRAVSEPSGSMVAESSTAPVSGARATASDTRVSADGLSIANHQDSGTLAASA